MRPRTKELLELVKRSRGQKVGVEHIRDLVADVRTDADAFLLEAATLLAPAGRARRRQPGPADPLSLSLEGFQARAGLDRKSFLGFLVEKLVQEDKALKRLAKKDQTLPRVIAFYGPLVGAERLEALGDWVARQHSQSH